MREIIIETHNFEASKKQLKAFSEQTPEDLELSKVEISGKFFGLGDHKVTGYELNRLATQIQDYLIEYNLLHTKFIKEFGQVYNALEALDKDYIQAILIAIKSAEKANTEAKIAQGDITKTIELQKKTINVLKQFKEKIESYMYLDDIDEIWSDSQKLKKDVSTISNNINNVSSSIKSNTQELKLLNKFKEQIEKLEHIEDVDKLWNQSESFSKEISNITKKIDGKFISIESQEQSIDILFQFKNKLQSYEHLEKIDEVWNKCRAFELDIITSKDIINNHEEQINSLKNCLQEMQDQNDEINQKFSKRLKIAYALGAGAIGIAIMEFALLTSRIIQ